MFVEKIEFVEKMLIRLFVVECVFFLLVKEGSCLFECCLVIKVSDFNIIVIFGGYIEVGEN